MKKIYDKVHKREVLDSSGRGNVIQLFEDKPPIAPFGEPAWNMYLGDYVELIGCFGLNDTFKYF